MPSPGVPGKSLRSSGGASVPPACVAMIVGSRKLRRSRIKASIAALIVVLCAGPYAAKGWADASKTRTMRQTSITSTSTPTLTTTSSTRTTSSKVSSPSTVSTPSTASTSARVSSGAKASMPRHGNLEGTPAPKPTLPPALTIDVKTQTGAAEGVSPSGSKGRGASDEAGGRGRAGANGSIDPAARAGGSVGSIGSLLGDAVRGTRAIQFAAMTRSATLKASIKAAPSPTAENPTISTPRTVTLAVTTPRVSTPTAATPILAERTAAKVPSRGREPPRSSLRAPADRSVGQLLSNVVSPAQLLVAPGHRGSVLASRLPVPSADLASADALAPLAVGDGRDGGAVSSPAIAQPPASTSGRGSGHRGMHERAESASAVPAVVPATAPSAPTRLPGGATAAAGGGIGSAAASVLALLALLAVPSFLATRIALDRALFRSALLVSHLERPG